MNLGIVAGVPFNDLGSDPATDARSPRHFAHQGHFLDVASFNARKCRSDQVSVRKLAIGGGIFVHLVDIDQPN